MAGTAIACTYCGGFHERVADVRACWSRSQDTAALATPAPAVLPVAPRRDPAAWAGPDGLGRNLLVEGAPDLPAPWAQCEVVDTPVDASADDRLADRLLAAAHSRERLVFRTGGQQAVAHVERREPWRLDASFRFTAELVDHLVSVNAVDLRPGADGRFPWTDRAVALGARPADDGVGDVVLPDGSRAYCDGGPLRFLSGAEIGVDGVRIVHRVALEHGSLIPLRAEASTADLAPDQLAAVTHQGGAARIIAPAGSGKTRVLTERARHLLTRWRVPPDAVCLVAYNVRAASEMRARTTDLPGLQIRTLNSLALAVVNGAPPFARRTERRQTIEEPAVRDLLGSLVDLPRRSNTDPAAAWLEALSAVRLGLRDPAAVEDEYRGDVDGLPAVFPRFRTLLAERGVLDFDEQVYRAVEVLLGEPDARHAAQRACRLLLVDEFQDLTPAHVLLLRLVAGPDAAVFGVGDDDQTIYGYAGASPQWLIGFEALFPGAGEHALEVNYRCPPAVVAAADRLLRRNRVRVPKRIGSAPGRPSEPDDLVVLSGDGGAVGSTAERVGRLLADGARPADVAVLARVNAALVPVQVALGESGVPVRHVLGEAWVRRTAVEAALAWLRIAVAPHDIAADDLRLALRRPPRGIAPRVVDWMAEQGSVAKLLRLADRLQGRDAPKVHGLADDVARLSDLVRIGGDAARALSTVRDELGLERAMVSLEGARRRLDRSAQTDDLDALVALGRLHPDVTTFEAWLREHLRRPSVDDGVVLATVHAVKGQEWPHVVVHDATAGVMPHRLAADVEEERRVFHVAVTRGVSTVAVSVGKPPSPFVAELFREPGDDPRPAPAPVQPARPSTSRGVRPAGDAAVVERAEALLREWRRGRADAENKPAFTLLHDATLVAIASALPSSLEELGAIKGIGPAKLERFGDEILAVVAEVRED